MAKVKFNIEVVGNKQYAHLADHYDGSFEIVETLEYDTSHPDYDILYPVARSFYHSEENGTPMDSINEFFMTICENVWPDSFNDIVEIMYQTKGEA